MFKDALLERRFWILMCWITVGLSFLARSSTQSCTPSSTLQESALFGLSGQDVAESSIAIGTNRVVVATLGQSGTVVRCRIAVRGSVDGSSSWTFEQQVPAVPIAGASQFDPTVVYDAQNGDFLVLVKHTSLSGSIHRVDVIRYHPSSNTFDQAWTNVATVTGAGLHIDRPFILAGAPDEFYVIWWNRITHQYHYRRTVNGGFQTSDWQGGVVTDSATGTPIAAGGFVQASVYEGSSIYLAYYRDQTLRSIDLLEGADCGSAVCFTKLAGVGGSTLSVGLRTDFNGIDAIAPGDFPVGIIPQIAIDPTNYKRFYVVYHDSDASSAADVNVYCQKAEAISGVWTLGSQMIVNDNPLPPAGCNESSPHTDQFTPTAIVDSKGRLHVVYYDDKNLCQDDSASTAQSAFDLSYAVSCDAGVTFSRQTLSSLTQNDAFLDWRADAGNTFGPRDYNGIHFRERGDHVTVWVSACGTDSSGDSSSNETVTYGVRLIQ